MARRQVGAIHCAHPAGLIVRPSPQHRGPVWRASRARGGRSNLLDLASNEAMDGRWRSDRRAVGGVAAAMPIARARRACPTAGMQEFAPARDRQAARAVETTRRCRDHRHGRNGFWVLFAETKSTPLAAEASGTRKGVLEACAKKSVIERNRLPRRCARRSSTTPRPPSGSAGSPGSPVRVKDRSRRATAALCERVSAPGRRSCRAAAPAGCARRR